MRLVLLIFLAFIFTPIAALASHLVPPPVKTFAASAPKTTSGQPITLSWTTTGLSGVNIQIVCNDPVLVSSPSYTGNFPCSKPVFSSPLGANSSLTLNFTNPSPDDKQISFLLLASFDGTTYDAAHGSSLNITVSTDVTPDPVISFFNASSTEAVAGSAVKIAWSALYVKGVNIRIACHPTITVATSSSKDALDLPCYSNAFVSDLPQNGTQTFFFRKTSAYSESILFTIVPGLGGGGYDLVRKRTFSFNVSPAAALPPPALPPPTPSTGSGQAAPAPAPPPVLPAASPPPTPARVGVPIPTPGVGIGAAPPPSQKPVSIVEPPAPPAIKTEEPDVVPKPKVDRPFFDLPPRPPRQEKKLSFFARFLNFLGNLLGLTPPPR